MYVCMYVSSYACECVCDLTCRIKLHISCFWRNLVTQTPQGHRVTLSPSVVDSSVTWHRCVLYAPNVVALVPSSMAVSTWRGTDGSICDVDGTTCENTLPDTPPLTDVAVSPLGRRLGGGGGGERRTSISLLESRRLKEAPLAGFHIKLSRDPRLGVYPCTVRGRILPRRLTPGPSVPL